MNKYSILLSCFTFVLFGCSQNNPKDIQNEVFMDIFYMLIEDSTQDYRKLTFPSPEQVKLRKQGGDISKKNIDDKRKMLVVINDSIRVPRIPKSQNTNFQSYDLNTLNKFNFNNFNYNKDNIHLVSNKEYNEMSKNLLNEFYFGGFLDISQVIFQDNLNEAYLLVNYRFGKLNSQKTKIYIKRVNNEWKIVNTETISFS